MKKEHTIQSVLRLDRLVFDKIEFKRLGFSSDHKLELDIQSSIAQRQDTEVYRITLTLRGTKPEEYIFEISLTGIFTIEQDDTLSEELKNDLITKNAIAILMPYMRSEVSLLTAQPGMECVVLPAFNINEMMKSSKDLS